MDYFSDSEKIRRREGMMKTETIIKSFVFGIFFGIIGILFTLSLNGLYFGLLATCYYLIRRPMIEENIEDKEEEQ